MRTTTRILATLSALVAAAGLLTTAGRAHAGQVGASLQVAAQLGRHVAVFADRTEVRLVPGESATVMVTVKVRMARGETLKVALDAPWANGQVRYRFQNVDGTLAGPTSLGAVAASGVYRIPLTLTLDRRAPAPVRIPLAVRPGSDQVTVATSGFTRVAP